MTAPRLAVTLGDPAGIGPEIVARLLADPEVAAQGDICVVGPAWALERGSAAAGVALDWKRISIEDVRAAATERPAWGSGGAASGAWAMATLEVAATLAEAGDVHAVVTAPVSKAAIHSAGHRDFVGHTEYFGRRVGVEHPTMFFWSDRWCVALVTVHCALREVPGLLTPDRIRETIRRTLGILRALGTQDPVVGVCGVNPHAGEAGLFGREDADRIAPVVEEFRQAGERVEGPLPADTAFMRIGRGDFHALVAMYHDQGLAPFKLVAFDRGVNVTLGLPYIRTSVDHGTAFDIAGRGMASPSSLHAAVTLARRLAHATAASR